MGGGHISWDQRPLGCKGRDTACKFSHLFSLFVPLSYSAKRRLPVDWRKYRRKRKWAQQVVGFGGTPKQLGLKGEMENVEISCDINHGFTEMEEQ